MKKSAKILKNAAYPIAVIAIVLIAWYFAAIAADSEFILPEPVATLRALTAFLGEPGFWTAFGATVLRAIAAFISSLAAALILALVSRFFKPLESLLSPLVAVLRALPTMAVVLLLIVWAGARKAPVIVAIMVLLPTLYAAFTEALGNVNRDVIDMAKIDGASRLTLALRFYLPLAAPLASCSTAACVSLGLKLTVAAEVLASTAKSIGMMMQLARIYFDVAGLIALTVLTVIAALVLEKLVYALLSLSFRSWI